MRRQSQISWRYWWWTHADENLFDLTPEQFHMFKLLVEGYYAIEGSSIYTNS